MQSEFATPPDWRGIIAANQRVAVKVEDLKRVCTSWEKREPIKAAYLHGMIEMLECRGVSAITYISMSEYIDMSERQKTALMKAILVLQEQKIEI